MKFEGGTMLTQVQLPNTPKILSNNRNENCFVSGMLPESQRFLIRTKTRGNLWITHRLLMFTTFSPPTLARDLVPTTCRSLV